MPTGILSDNENTHSCQIKCINSEFLFLRNFTKLFEIQKLVSNVDFVSKITIYY